MRNFAFRVEDDRAAEPAVRKATLRDELAARTLAERILRETYHHRSIEVWEATQQVCVLKATET